MMDTAERFDIDTHGCCPRHGVRLVVGTPCAACVDDLPAVSPASVSPVRFAVDQYSHCPRHGLKVKPDTPCAGCVADEPAIDPARRLNIGCGQWPLLYWTNIDGDPRAIADRYQQVPPLPYADASLDEIYAGHFLEHLTYADGQALLVECFRCLVPGGRIGIVVPDTREVLTRWFRGDLDCVEYPVGVWHAVKDLDDVCGLFFYHTADPFDRSPHLWAYDLQTLERALTRAGFEVTGEIDRYRDPRIPVGAWYQCGLDAIKPEAEA